MAKTKTTTDTDTALNDRVTTILAALKRAGYEPIDELVKLAQSADASDRTRERIATKLLDVTTPKLASVDLSVRGRQRRPDALVARALGIDDSELLT